MTIAKVSQLGLRDTIGYVFDTPVYIPPGAGIIQDGLVLHYDAGNSESYPGTGTTWSDLAGTNNGTIYNATYNSSNGGYFNFDGNGDYVRLGSFLPSATRSAHTINLFIKRNASANFFPRIFMDDGVNESITITDNGSPSTGAVLYRTTKNNTFSTITTAAGTMDGSWQYLTCWWNGSTMRVYINGVQTGSDLSAPSPTDTVQTFLPTLGGSPDAANASWFNGDIAQLQIYDRALTEEEILINFNIDKARYGL